MPTTEQTKRPRIRHELAAEIDRLRGDVPFERYVNRLIERALAVNLDRLAPDTIAELIRKEEQTAEREAIERIRSRPAPFRDE